MKPPLVYVIIINWNGREHLDDCFESLLLSTWTNAVFLLVDNASTDDSVAFVASRFGQDARVEILPLERNLGWSGGNNAGIRRALDAGADYILLLNNDTATDSSGIEHMVSVMAADETLGALAPRMVLFDQPDIINSTGLMMSVIGAAWDNNIGRFDGPQWHETQPVLGVCGGACFIRASVFSTTGLLPEDFEIYLDDLDLCLRIWSSGYRIEYCPEAVVRHKFSATMGTGLRARRKYFLNTRNRFRILLRHFPWSRIAGVLRQLIVGEIRAMGRGLLSGEVWRVWAHIQAWCSAIAYLPNALTFRRAANIGGASRFWSMVCLSPLFCPEILLPVRGWYPPVLIEGETFHPMAKSAALAITAGPLQVRLANCYPALGESRVSLYSGNTLLLNLHTDRLAEADLDVPGGVLSLVSSSEFLMEDTGGPSDVAAWLQLVRDGIPLIQQF